MPTPIWAHSRQASLTSPQRVPQMPPWQHSVAQRKWLRLPVVLGLSQNHPEAEVSRTSSLSWPREARTKEPTHLCPCLSTDLPGCHGDVESVRVGETSASPGFYSNVIYSGRPSQCFIQNYIFHTTPLPPPLPCFLYITELHLTDLLSTSAPTPLEHKLQEGSLFVCSVHRHLSCS